MSALAVRVRMIGRMMAEAVKAETAWRDLSRWSRHDNASSGRISWDEDEQAVRVDAEWRESAEVGDRWCYPMLALDKESLAEALVVEFEAKNSQEGRVENDWKFAMAQFRSGPRGERRSANAIMNPIPDQWEVRRIEVPVEAKVANDMQTVSFGPGGSPRGHQVSLWIRNVKVVKKNR